MSKLVVLQNYFLLWIYLLHICCDVSRHFHVSATKDGSLGLEEVTFPPVFVPSSDPTIPAGHLQMFGLQRPPNGPVVEYNTVLKPQQFWETHVSQNRPLVFRQALVDSPALKKWTDEYLKETYGDLDVLTELKTENRTHGMTSRMLLGDFIDVYADKNLYVVTVLPDPMRQDLPPHHLYPECQSEPWTPLISLWIFRGARVHYITVLPCIMCGTFKDFLHELNFWMSSGGTRSVIHFDADHNVHCLIAGRKDFTMINQEFSKYLNVTQPPQFGSGFSIANPDVIDLNLFPDISKVEWTYSTLGPGDCIYIPSGYIHQVRSYKGNRTISATMLFTASIDNSFDNSSCENETYEYRPLSEANVHWTYKKGDKTIDMGYQNVETFRQSILASFENEKFLTEERFKEIIEDMFEMDEHDLQAIQRDTHKIYREFLDPSGKGYVTREEIKALSQDTLKEIARRTEPPHGPVAGASDDRGGAYKASLEKDADQNEQEIEVEGRDEL